MESQLKFTLSYLIKDVLKNFESSKNSLDRKVKVFIAYCKSLDIGSISLKNCHILLLILEYRTITLNLLKEVWLCARLYNFIKISY